MNSRLSDPHTNSFKLRAHAENQLTLQQMKVIEIEAGSLCGESSMIRSDAEVVLMTESLQRLA
jgi:hypothetical protein